MLRQRAPRLARDEIFTANVRLRTDLKQKERPRRFDRARFASTARRRYLYLLVARMNDSAVPAPNLCDRALPHDVRRDLFGGRGTVRVWSLTSAPALPFTAVLACELE